jgi:RNA polymerase sigma factor (sigma-70 family)
MANPNIASRFDEIYNSTNKAVLAFITAKCKNTVDISDIFQDTYMELYQVLIKRGAEYVANEKAFVLRIAKQKISRYYSLLKRLQMFISMTVITDDNEEIDLYNADIDSFLMEDSTEDYIINKILLEKLWQIIDKKPADVKKIFYLFYDVGLSIPEIAQTLSLNESNVKSKIYRTVKELQTFLKKEGNQDETK